MVNACIGPKLWFQVFLPILEFFCSTVSWQREAAMYLSRCLLVVAQILMVVAIQPVSKRSKICLYYFAVCPQPKFETVYVGITIWLVVWFVYWSMPQVCIATTSIELTDSIWFNTTSVDFLNIVFFYNTVQS